MVYNVPPTAVADQPLSSANWNSGVRDSIMFLHDPPSCRAYNSAALSIPNATFTSVALNSERWDNDAIHDPVTNNSRLTSKTNGLYLVSFTCEFAANATGVRVAYLRFGGATFFASQGINALAGGFNSFLSVVGVYSLGVNDYVEAQVYQNSGGALNLNSTGVYSPELSMSRIG